MADQPSNRSNRIDVDLKLMATKDMEMLQSFGEKFAASVTTLDKMLGGYAKQLEGATQRLSSSAPTSFGLAPAGHPIATTYPDQLDQQQARQDEQQARIEKVKTNIQGIGRFAYRDDNTHPFERDLLSSSRFGEFSAVDLIRLLSMKSADRGFETGPDGATTVRSPVLAGVSGALGFAGRAVPYAASVGLLASRFRNSGQGPTSLGLNLGQSRHGPLGSSFFSPAYNTGISSLWDAATLSDFGLNPNYSLGQAKSAMDAVNEYGYSGGTGEQLRNTLKSVEIDTGIGSSTAMSLIDPSIRFGGASLADITKQLYNIPQAAAAARMGVQQFTEQLVQTSTALAQEMGIQTPTAMHQLSSFSGATGFSPEVGQNLLGDQRLAWLTSARTGQNLYQVTAGPFAGSNRTKTVLSLVSGLTGASLAQMRANPKLLSSKMSYLQALYWKDPSLLGGMTPTQIAHLIQTPHVLGSETAMEAIDYAQSNNLSHGAGAFTLDRIMQESGYSSKQMQWFQSHHSGESYQKQLSALQSEIRNASRHAQNQASKVLVDLAPGVKDKILKLIRPEQNPASRSSDYSFGGGIAREAVNTAESTFLSSGGSAALGLGASVAAGIAGRL